MQEHRAGAERLVVGVGDHDHESLAGARAQCRRHANSSIRAAISSGTSNIGKWLRASSRCTSNHGCAAAKACCAASTVVVGRLRVEVQGRGTARRGRRGRPAGHRSRRSRRRSRARPAASGSRRTHPWRQRIGAPRARRPPRSTCRRGRRARRARRRRPGGRRARRRTRAGCRAPSSRAARCRGPARGTESAAQLDGHPAGVREGDRHDALQAQRVDEGDGGVDDVRGGEVGARSRRLTVLGQVDGDGAAVGAEPGQQPVEDGAVAAPAGQEQERGLAAPGIRVGQWVGGRGGVDGHGRGLLSDTALCSICPRIDTALGSMSRFCHVP